MGKSSAMVLLERDASEAAIILMAAITVIFWRDVEVFSATFS